MDKKVQVSAKMTSKNQITVPKSVRQTLGLKENQKVIFEFTPEDELKGTSEKTIMAYEDFWNNELVVMEEHASDDTEIVDFGEAVGEEKIEW
ncbi:MULTISPECIES: AbrB/MazE/SpoVT family DNA-binding domain-containing protein [Enterococcus]|uniref:AbrB/MazE/SpoVT family DNA-binding domain-containing protein n=1 Tax=Enterococcus TaxID=1350 RepID=UPI00129D2161|nr:AbrB/MazE/SpoVT family DNA-binding domain-containing protein [Enterococcus mundtii]MBE9910606.1 AbrB/MazE/SpoVT family DNA-binding domain-containing protein [Enterococcus mundtii]MRI72920.1 AbrB family transcriptional regulator [Enterococcus mundtii]GKS53977.1 AbrB family transcriptional regulator [Enterococcus mundtii]